MKKVITPHAGNQGYFLNAFQTLAIRSKSAITSGILGLMMVTPCLSYAVVDLNKSFTQQIFTAFPVTGQVTDKNGESLPGVSIVIKNTTSGTITDADGKYQIEVNDDQTVLIFSFVGYVSQEIQVGNSKQLNVTLESDEKSLNEVVVIGYGSTKKSDLTGSVGQLDVSSAVKAPVGSIG